MILILKTCNEAKCVEHAKKNWHFYNELWFPVKRIVYFISQATLKIEKYGDLGVRITGASCKLPDPVDTLFFSCRVREKVMWSLNIENDTATLWKLKPEIIGDYFLVEEVLHVPSKKSVTCTITYAPLAMNSESNPHEVIKRELG